VARPFCPLSDGLPCRVRWAIRALRWRDRARPPARIAAAHWQLCLLQGIHRRRAAVVYLNGALMALISRAHVRRAPTRRARSADRPAIRATRWRRLGGGWPTSPILFIEFFLEESGSGRTLELGRSERTNADVAAAAPAALDRISHGVDFRHHPIETALNCVLRVNRSRSGRTMNFRAVACGCLTHPHIAAPVARRSARAHQGTKAKAIVSKESPPCFLPVICF